MDTYLVYAIQEHEEGGRVPLLRRGRDVGALSELVPQCQPLLLHQDPETFKSPVVRL